MGSISISYRKWNKIKALKVPNGQESAYETRENDELANICVSIEWIDSEMAQVNYCQLQQEEVVDEA